MLNLPRFIRELACAYRGHHEHKPMLLEAIGAFGAIAFSALYLVRLTGKLPNRWDDLNFRLVAILLCLILALRRSWPRALERWYLPYSYAAVFYCLAFFLPLTLLKNGGALNTIVNMVIGAVLITLLTDWRNTIVTLLAGYAASAAVYWAITPHPQFPVEFLYWWVPMCSVLVAGGSISKYVEGNTPRRLYEGLAGSIAHEMRTPLAEVGQKLDAIEALVPPGSEAAVAVVQGRRAISRGLQAVSITLHQVKNQAPDASEFRDLSAAHCTRLALAEYAFEDDDQRDKVTLQVAQDFTFRGDETTLVLVLFNLLRNALYYLPLHPHARVSLHVEASPANRIVVHDTGPGIAPELLGRLFEDFQTAGKAEGTGLGLAFCRRAMRAVGGEIECATELGRFTRFTLTFPHVDAARLPAQTKSAAQMKTAVIGASLCGRRVLVVDDSAPNRAMTRLRLRELGIQAIEANHAADALRMLRDGADADAIVMDMNMPGMDGLAATRALRAQGGPLSRTPVLLVTADPTTSARLAAFEAGVDAFLLKPLNADLLRAELMKLMPPVEEVAGAKEG